MIEVKVNLKKIEISRKFEKEFFDGSCDHGYGGFIYNPRFWQPVAIYI